MIGYNTGNNYGSIDGNNDDPSDGTNNGNNDGSNNGNNETNLYNIMDLKLFLSLHMKPG